MAAAQGDSVDKRTGEEDNHDCMIEDPSSMIKHPLQNRWSLWYFKNDKTKDWALNLKMVASFDTVEDFWALYNYIQPASKLAPGCDYSVFKDGIQPMWEDDKNKRGGRWLINLDKRQRQTDLDKFWLETLMCLIGEGFDEVGEEVCGAVINIRAKGDKLCLWTALSNSDSNVKIGRRLKERLSVPHKLTIGYQAHTDTISRTGSTAKNRYTV